MSKKILGKMKNMETLLYKFPDINVKKKIRNLSLSIFDLCEDIISKDENLIAYNNILEEIEKSMNNISDSVLESDFDRIKTNNDLVIPYITKLSEYTKT